MAELAKEEPRKIARPLAVLVPLIKTDLDQGRKAAEQAGLPYYRSAGEKLLEAKSQLPHGEFQSWVKRHFILSIETAKHYMRLAAHAAAENGSALPFTSLSDFIRQTSNPNYNRPFSREPVKYVLGRVDIETLNLTREARKRADEWEALRQIQYRIVDVGYKALAREHHPDKGGTSDTMARLNKARDVLKNRIRQQ